MMTRIKNPGFVFLLSVSCFTFSCEAEEPDCPVTTGEAVPADVVEAFSNQYANATDLQWCEASGDYVAAFNTEDGEKYALFDAAGQLLTEGDDDVIEERAGCECELNDD